MFWDVNHTISETQAAKRGFIAGIGTSIDGSALDYELGISDKINYACDKAKKMFKGE